MFVVLAIILLGVIVTAHEFGHFLAAKSFGVGVVEFSVGMGPRLFAWKGKETVYSLRLLPIGGYCAMYGELSPEADGKGEETGTAAETKPSRFPAYKTDWPSGRALTAASKWRQMVIYAMGPLFNVFLAFLAALVIVSLPDAPYGRAYIEDFVEGTTVAQEAGIEIGDYIVSVEDRDVLISPDYSTFLDTHPKLDETGYRVTLYRPSTDGTYTAFVRPDAETGLIGIRMRASEVTSMKDRFAASYGLMRHWALTVVDSLGMLIRGDAHITDMSGFLGMTSVMGESMEEAAKEDMAPQVSGGLNFNLLRTAMMLIVFISINLGIMNMLPIPALDGGRFLMAWIEGAFNRQIPMKVQLALNTVTMGGLLLLIGVVTVMDALRLFGVM